jgi:hypothetical protein
MMRPAGFIIPISRIDRRLDRPGRKEQLEQSAWLAAVTLISHEIVRVSAPRGGEVKHSLLVVASADLRYEHAKKRGPLTALPLAHDWFGDRFFEARCRLGGKSAGRCL